MNVSLLNSGVLISIVCAVGTFAVGANGSKSSTSTNYLYVVPQGEPASSTQVLLQPNGPFAAMVFHEDALGDILGLIYYRPMTNPVEGSWKIDDRFWQRSEWAFDVTSLAWGRSGTYLYVGTMNVYGDGGLFRIDLRNRRAARVFPTPDLLKSNNMSDDTYSSRIVGIDLQKMVLQVNLASEEPGKSVLVRAEIPYE